MAKSPRAAIVPATRSHALVTVRKLSGTATVASAASRVLQCVPKCSPVVPGPFSPTVSAPSPVDHERVRGDLVVPHADAGADARELRCEVQPAVRRSARRRRARRCRRRSRG